MAQTQPHLKSPAATMGFPIIDALATENELMNFDNISVKVLYPELLFFLHGLHI
jgi:hypothetical protein